MLDITSEELKSKMNELEVIKANIEVKSVKVSYKERNKYKVRYQKNKLNNDCRDKGIGY